MRLKPAYETEIQQWEALNLLAAEVQRFQKATPKEYSTAVEELLRLEDALSTSDFPEKFNIPAVKSRISLFKTYLLQTKSLLEPERIPRDTLSKQHTKIILAFNAVKKQIAETLTNAMAQELLKDIEQ